MSPATTSSPGSSTSGSSWRSGADRGTVGAAGQDFGALNTPIALAIAVTKATLVILFFMHVKYSPRLTTLVLSRGLRVLVPADHLHGQRLRQPKLADHPRRVTRTIHEVHLASFVNSPSWPPRAIRAPSPNPVQPHRHFIPCRAFPLGYDLRMTRLSWTSLAASVFFLVGSAASFPDAGNPAAARVRADVTRLASADWQGRRAGTPGADRAADWLGDEFRRIGLRPGGDGRHLLPEVQLHRRGESSAPAIA